MLNEKELKIGNYINYEGETCTISANDLVDISDGDDLKGIGEYIPLTKDLFLALGFSVDEECNEYSYNDNCELTFRESDLKGCFGVYQIKMDGFKLIKYVHELQNLLSALTGIELSLQF